MIGEIEGRIAKWKSPTIPAVDDGSDEPRMIVVANTNNTNKTQTIQI